VVTQGDATVALGLLYDDNGNLRSGLTLDDRTGLIDAISSVAYRNCAVRAEADLELGQ
jgi:hypothetical protein